MGFRTQLIAQQGFVTSATGFCRQNGVPSPTSPQDIITPNGVLGYSGDTYSGDGDYYFIDGAGKEYHMPLMLEGDTIEINWRTMKAKLTHRFKAARILGTYVFVASTSYDGSVYIRSSNVRSYFPDAKYRTGKIICNYFRNQDYVSGETSATGKGKCMWSDSNDCLNFWPYDSETEASSNPNAFFQNHTVYFVYELATPSVEYIDLTTKLRNHPLMAYGQGVEKLDVSFVQGYIDINGDVAASNQHITSNFIEGGRPIRIDLKNVTETDETTGTTTIVGSYKVTQVHLYKESGELVGYNFFSNTFNRSAYKNGQHWEVELPIGYKMRFTIIYNAVLTTSASGVNTPAGEINPQTDCVNYVMALDTMYFKRQAYTNRYWKNGYIRAKQLCNIMWKPVIYKDYHRSATAYPNYMDKDNVTMGIPYSEAGDQNKFIGKQVSFRTFISAIHNPISLFYSETPVYKVDQNVYHISNYPGISYVGDSEAGIDYVGTEADGTLYYGMVCACLVDYVLGTADNHTAAQYRGGNDTSDHDAPATIITNWIGTNTSSVTNYIKLRSISSSSVGSWTSIYDDNHICKLRPMDVLAYKTHVVVVVDILRELQEDGTIGDVKFIQLIESVSPHVITSYCTPEEFLARFSPSNGSYIFWRFPRKSIPKPEAYPFIRIEPNDVIEEFVPNSDICTFAGDYATFAQNQPVHISVNNTESKWIGIKVYKEGVSTPILTRSLTDEAYCRDKNTSGATFISDVYTSLEQSWVDVDISDLFVNTTESIGKYGVYTCVAYNQNEESEPTHFEVLYMRFSAYTTSSRTYFVAKCKGGTPYSIAPGASSSPYGNNGYGPAVINLTGLQETDRVDAGEIPECWQDVLFSRYTYGAVNENVYSRFLCQGLYGFASVRIQGHNTRSPITFNTGSYFNSEGALVAASAANQEKVAYTANKQKVDEDETYMLYIYDVASSPLISVYLVEYEQYTTIEQTTDYRIVSAYNVIDKSEFTGSGKYLAKVYTKSSADVTHIAFSVPSFTTNNYRMFMRLQL